MNRILVFILIFTSTVAAEVDRIFLVQDRLYSAALKSLANAGIALPTDLFNGLTNPALTFSHYHTVVPQSNGTAAIGYGQDSIFNAHIFPAGLSYSNQEGSIGLFYRFMKGKMDILQHEMIINFASQIFPKSDDQGSVDFGINLRFEKMVWKNRPQGCSTFWRRTQADGYWKEEVAQIKTIRSDKRFLLDMGFFNHIFLKTWISALS